MKTKIFTPFSVLLATTICASTIQPSYAQQPPRLTAVSTYYKDASTPGFFPQDSTYYRYDLPNAYNATKRAWLYEAEIKNLYDDIAGAFSQNWEANYYTYDNNGNTTAKIEMSYFSKWDTSYQTYTTYNSNNQILTQTYKGRIALNSPWETWKDMYAYDGSNNLIEKIEQKLDDATGTWANLERETYTYSASRKTADIYFTWYNGQWRSQTRTVYQYKGSLIDTIRDQLYDATTGSSADRELITMTYTANNDVDTLSYFDWISGSWVGTKRYSQTFDNKHNVLTYTRQYWSGSAWAMNNRDSTVYNAANLPTIIVSELDWDDVTGKFEISGNTEIRYFYYQDPTYLKEDKAISSALKVFPNPAASVLMIQIEGGLNQFAAFTVYDATGKAVKYWNEPPTTYYSRTIDISDLPSGQYVLRQSSDNYSYQRFTVLQSKQ